MDNQTAFVIHVEQEGEAAEAIPADPIRQVVTATLVAEGIEPGAALSVLLTGDATLRELNRQYRDEDRTTDVLSFPAGPVPDDVTALAGYLGDIAISVPQATQQADEKGHPIIAEVQLLAIHGTLHLIGYDHLEEQERSAMWTRQAAVLASFGLGDIQPTESEHDTED